MAGTDYTEKQLAEHLAAFERGEGLPENSVFNPAGFARGEPILRKMTAEELAAHGVTPATASPSDDKKEGQ